MVLQNRARVDSNNTPYFMTDFLTHVHKRFFSVTDDEGAGPVWSSTPRRTAPDGLGLRFISSAVRNGGVGGGSAPPLRRADVMDVIRSLQTELDATTNRVRELEFRTRAASPPPVEAPSGALGLSSAQLALVVLWPIAVTAAWEFVRQRRATGRR